MKRIALFGILFFLFTGVISASKSFKIQEAKPFRIEERARKLYFEIKEKEGYDANEIDDFLKKIKNKPSLFRSIKPWSPYIPSCGVPILDLIEANIAWTRFRFVELEKMQLFRLSVLQSNDIDSDVRCELSDLILNEFRKRFKSLPKEKVKELEIEAIVKACEEILLYVDQ